MALKLNLIIASILSTTTAFWASYAQGQGMNICQLDEAIATTLENDNYRQAHWGIAVQDIATGELVYGRHAQQLFIPASTAKLFTTAAGLELLGPDHQFATTSYTQGTAPHLDTLVVHGGGDPTLQPSYFEDVGRSLTEQGIQSINRVVIDDSLFTEAAVHPTWEWSDLAFYYAVPINSLILADNITTLELQPSSVGQPAAIIHREEGAIALAQWDIDNQLITAPAGTPYQGQITQTFGTQELTVTGQIAADAEPDIWWLSVPDPAQHALDQLLFTLAQKDIAVQRTSITTTTFPAYDSAAVLHQDKSPSFPVILQTINQNSDNLYAESLRHLLGTLDDYDTGAEAIATTLVNFGIPADSFVIADGSGLSRHNLATPASFATLLDVMTDHPDADIWENSLAIAGASGSLRRRFIDTPIAGNLYGKTGTMTHVVTFAGYLELPGDRTLAISILVNQSPQRATITRQGIDEIVAKIYHWGNHCLP